jgi:1,4-dihydroxy-2-naphthoyl-CoA hydrolase
MSAIWKKDDITTDSLNELRINTLADILDIRFSEIGDNYLKATMPVNERTRQPYGLLHGGASAALAETIGSVASACCIDPETQMCVGIEINCNHIKAKRNGLVTATVTPLHIGKTIHVWNIRICDEHSHLICISRLTVSVLKKR